MFFHICNNFYIVLANCLIFLFTVLVYIPPPAEEAPPGAAGGGSGNTDNCESLGGNLGWIGDQICDDENNISDCQYDGGDCCMDPMDTSYCSVCECLQ